MVRHMLITAAMLSVLIGAAAGAQPVAGNILAVRAGDVLEFTPAGTLHGTFNLPRGHTGLAICPSVDNRGAAILTHEVVGGAIVSHVLELKYKVLTTVASATTPPGPLAYYTRGGLVPEQGGGYVGATPLGILRFDPSTGAATTLNTLHASGIGENVSTGGWYVFQGAATVCDITRDGTVSRVATISSEPPPVGIGGLFTDRPTGDVLVAYWQLFKLDAAARKFSTVLLGLPYRFIAGGDIEPATRSMVVFGSGGIYKVDRHGALVTTVSSADLGVHGVTFVGSNGVSGSGAATPGATYNLTVSYLEARGHFYQLAASFGFKPGIVTPFGRVPLNPDSLFFASMLAPGIFRSFAGKLDVMGTGRAAIALPNITGLVGRRFFVAAGVYDSRGVVKFISEPMGVTID